MRSHPVPLAAQAALADRFPAQFRAAAAGDERLRPFYGVDPVTESAVAAAAAALPAGGPAPAARAELARRLDPYQRDLGAGAAARAAGA
ncbi:MAG: hypothetical protein HZA54_19870, partial [Planctomycetes bacterium]|nr:hypothetical protein [Planctomycetota bacterium]